MAARKESIVTSTKRKRFSAAGITPKALRTADRFASADGSELVATVRRWGTTFGVFEDGSKTEPLWQIQVVQGGRQSFGYNLLATCREALQDYPDDSIRDLAQLEAQMHIKVLVGAPATTGASDPDDVGIQDWQPVLYAPTPQAGLDLVAFIVRHKVKSGQLLQLPHFIALFPREDIATVPSPWTVHEEHPLQQGPYQALPARGRRHVLLQVELQPPADEEASQQTPVGPHPKQEYSLMIFGNIYSFRELFDAANIQGGTVKAPDSEKSEYVRHLKLKCSEDHTQRLKNILEQVLLKTPVYLIDSTETPADPLISWLQEQPSVYLGEQPK
ncbi:unnamed protein product [Symbiodinium sp. CCMP2456]|nr:unnamed protein product [Symbiodinium sp. CCMP2456]